MRILGIDPGTQVVGYGCLEVSLTGVSPPAGSPEGRPPEGMAPTVVPLAQRARNVVSSAGAMRPRLVTFGTLRLGTGRLGKGRAPLASRLTRLATALDQLLRELSPQELALEEAFCGKSVQSALRIGEARGVIIATAGCLEVAVHQFSPARIKRSVTGHGSASKDQVAEMVARLLQLAALPEPQDASDALAVALCRVEQRHADAVGRTCNAAGPEV